MHKVIILGKKQQLQLLFGVMCGELKIDEESEEAKWFTKEELFSDPAVGPNTRYYASLILK